MRKIFVLFVILYFASFLYAEDLETLIGAERAAILLGGDSISEMQFTKSNPLLLPNQIGVENLIQSIQNSLDPKIIVESLFLYKKPPEANQGTWTEAERTAIYNHSLALSSLSGIEYYSSSRKKMRVFYETSVIIDNTESRTPQSDPVFFVPPKEFTLIARQKDLTFGDNMYKYTYQANEDFLFFVQENLTVMNAGIIHVAGKNKLRSAVAVIDAGEYFLIYVASMADAVMIPILSQRVGNSFSTRAEAILNWFTGQADKAFAFASENQ